MTTLVSVDDDAALVRERLEHRGRVDEAFLARFDLHFPRLHRAYGQVYAHRIDEREVLVELVLAAATAWRERPLELRVHDERHPWHSGALADNRMLAASCFADRFGGNLAGIGDQIPYLHELGVTVLHLSGVFEPSATEPDVPRSLRHIDPSIGSLTRLAGLAEGLRTEGVALSLDVVIDRVSPEHEWWRGAQSGDRDRRALFVAHAEAPILDFDNPDALRGVAEELFFLANHGIDLLRLGPRLSRHIASILSALVAIAAPGTLVTIPTHSDDAEDPAILPSPLSAHIWDAFATGDAAALQYAFARRPALASDATWMPRVRDGELAPITPAAAAFYADRGEAVDDHAIAGTTASLAGVDTDDPFGEDRVILAHALALASGGLPELYLGDEVAQLNDPTYADDPARRHDPRWLHRGHRPRDRYAKRHDVSASAGRVFRRIRHLVTTRQNTEEFGGTDLIGFEVPHPGVLAFQRPGDDDTVLLVLANVSTAPVTIAAEVFSGVEPDAHDVIRGREVSLAEGWELAPVSFVWLRVRTV